MNRGRLVYLLMLRRHRQVSVENNKTKLGLRVRYKPQVMDYHIPIKESLDICDQEIEIKF